MNIYIATPANTVTGGIELLHQLCNELNTYEDINSNIWYADNCNCITHPKDYEKYNNPIVSSFELGSNTTIIVPEIWANNIKKDTFKDCKKVIYWESVDNYTDRFQSDKYEFPRDTIYLAQSYYAYDFLLSRVNTDKNNVLYVTDYLNKEFIDTNIIKEKKRQVLFNPKKGLQFTEKIINASDNIGFIPIVNKTRSEVIELLRSSMLYIDFGHHPGKDRIPREAAISGCCVITSKRGSANNSKDVNIPDKYKFEDIKDNIPAIVDMINYILDNHTECKKDFTEYRSDIRKEYYLFKDGVKQLVKKLIQVEG